MDDARCYDTVRELRLPEGRKCPQIARELDLDRSDVQQMMTLLRYQPTTSQLNKLWAQPIVDHGWKDL